MTLHIKITPLKVWFLVALLSVSVFDTNGYCQTVAGTEVSSDSAKVESEAIQMKTDSTFKVFERKFKKLEEEQDARLDKIEKKNFILSVALMISIIVITIIQ